MQNKAIQLQNWFINKKSIKKFINKNIGIEKINKNKIQ